MHKGGAEVSRRRRGGEERRGSEEERMRRMTRVREGRFARARANNVGIKLEGGPRNGAFRGGLLT